MALIRGSMWGDLSGRVGGVVFSRNGIGKIVRQYVKGIDAHSVTQVNNRGLFSNVQGLWRSLSMSNRLSWGTFANSIYVPKHGRVAPKYTGTNAFMGINNYLSLLVSHDYDAFVTFPSSTYNSFPFSSMITSPPAFPFSGNGQTWDGVPLVLSIKDFTLAMPSGVCSLSVSLGGVEQAYAPLFKTPTYNLPFGFAVYISDPLSAGQTTTANKEAYLIGSIKNVVFTSWGVLEDNVQFSWTVPSSYFTNCKKTFLTGTNILVSLYQVGLDAQSAFLGRKLISVS